MEATHNAPASKGVASLSTDLDVGEVGVGDLVWLSDADASWVPGTVVETTQVHVAIEVRGRSRVLIPKIAVPSGGRLGTGGRRVGSVLADPRGGAGGYRLLHRSPPAGEDGVENMDDLALLHEAEILDNVRVRFSRDLPYTSTGPILISVNPYKWLPLYTDDVVWRYRRSGQWGAPLEPPAADVDASDDAGTGIGEGPLPPHCYAVAEDAFRGMVRLATNTSVIICGESGAGKTETTKLMLRYISKVASNSSHDEIANRIMESNPLMEAFGNAKTLRNNNSSRFGKFVRVYFDDASHRIAGASITSYLLEKSRVVAQASGERNYHVFYQLCVGIGDAQRATLGLRRDMTAFRYLSQSGCVLAGGARARAPPTLGARRTAATASRR